MSKVHGKNASITFNGTPLLYAAEWALQSQADYADVTVYGSQGKEYLKGLRGVDISFSGILDVGDSALWDAINGDLVAVAVLADTGATVAHGNGWVDGGATASVSDAVRMQGTIKGSGLWHLGS